MADCGRPEQSSGFSWAKTDLDKLMYSGNVAHQGNNDDSDHQAQSIRDNGQIRGGERVAPARRGGATVARSIWDNDEIRVGKRVAPTRGVTVAWNSAHEEDDLLLRRQIAVDL